jgi:hypothetical protein
VNAIARLDPIGYFNYRRDPFMALRWGQAMMYRSLAYLSLRRRVDG